MDSEFYRTYRLQLFRTRLSPFKDSVDVTTSNREGLREIKKAKNKKNKKLTKLIKNMILEKIAEDNPEIYV